MNTNKIQEVNSELLGEGYRIMLENGELSATIEWVDWVQQSDDADDIKIEVHFADDTSKTYEKGIKLKQIWHEDV